MATVYHVMEGNKFMYATRDRKDAEEQAEKAKRTAAPWGRAHKVHIIQVDQEGR